MNGDLSRPKLTPAIGCAITAAALACGLSIAAGMVMWQTSEQVDAQDQLWQERYGTNWLPAED